MKDLSMYKNPGMPWYTGLGQSGRMLTTMQGCGGKIPHFRHALLEKGGKVWKSELSRGNGDGG